jgi:hypothetical protein
MAVSTPLYPVLMGRFTLMTITAIRKGQPLKPVFFMTLSAFHPLMLPHQLKTRLIMVKYVPTPPAIHGVAG